MQAKILADLVVYYGNKEHTEVQKIYLSKQITIVMCS